LPGWRAIAAKDEEAQLEDLIEKLAQYVKSGTPAERRIAKYFSEHLSELSLETAASIAGRLDLSPMTVGRFLRALGYQGLDAIHHEVRDTRVSSAWHINDHMDVLRKDLEDGRLLADLMSEQIEALHQIYALAGQPVWANAVQSIVSAQEIFVASYQNVGGLARYFTEQLTYARGGVRYMDGQNGTYVELFGRDPKNTLLIVVACRRFATKARTLSRTAHKAGHRVLLITDQHCDWAREAADVVLSLPASGSSRTWDSFATLASLFDFLVTSVVVAAGEDTNARTRRISELQDLFGDFMRR
jgi:DNA-binding MurR/RpiR family transcriptional regulator